VDRIWIKLGTRRYRVIPRLETRDRRDNNVERDIPCGGILGGRGHFDVIACSELEKFAKFEAAFSDDGMVFFLAGVEVSEVSLGLGIRSEFS
jgi:hypothetical protein